ncbi:hypothetical protein [Catenovulum agarivorans]|uniref:hypothetical protein n=1 Tax=Catenovulum agarivorans TaxID=1172192 RepID=UPI0004AC5878|nr:hypothetical protein [Catenovulum agarivorans]
MKNLYSEKPIVEISTPNNNKLRARNVVECFASAKYKKREDEAKQKVYKAAKSLNW